MIDPPRILDRGDRDAGLERALIRAARARGPSPEARRRLLDALDAPGSGARAGMDAARRPRAPVAAAEEAPGLLFASVLQQGGSFRGRFWPGAVVAVAHAALFALVIHGSPRPVAEPRPVADTDLRMYVQRPSSLHRHEAEGPGQGAPGKPQEAIAAAQAKADRSPPIVAAAGRAGDPAAETPPLPGSSLGLRPAEPGSAPKPGDGVSSDTVPPPGREPVVEGASDERAAAFATAEAGSEVLPFGEGMTSPRLIEGPDPVYPREAREARVEGTMLVKCVITTRGTLEGCRVLRSLPFLEGPVLEALARRRYTPVTFQGRAVNVEYVIPIRFERR